MGSDVFFDSLYLDRCLRSGRYLDIVMLLLLGVASLMFRSDSVVFGLSGSCVWWWMIWCHLIFWSITHSTLYWDMFPSWMRFTDLDGVAHLSPHLRDVRRGDDLFAIFITIPQWSLCRAIQPGPFWPIVHSMPYWGIFLFGWDLQIFMELHAYLHLRDTHRDDDLFVILSWSPGRASLGSFSQAYTFDI